MSAFATGLWPFTEITAGVAVMNGAKIGNLSSTVTFQTPEGSKFSSSSQLIIHIIQVFNDFVVAFCACVNSMHDFEGINFY